MKAQLSKTAHAAMDLAREAAIDGGEHQAHTGHLLLGVLGAGGTAVRLLARTGADLDTLQSLAEETCRAGDGAPSGASRARVLQAVVRHARAAAASQGKDGVETEQLLLGMLEAGDGVVNDVFKGAGIDIEKLKASIRGAEDL